MTPQSVKSDLQCGRCPSTKYMDSTQHREMACKEPSVCSAGTQETAVFTVTTNTTCAACQVGKTWQEERGQPTCKEVSVCPAGKYTFATATATADTACTSCPAGQFQPLKGQGRCLNTTVCAPGTYTRSEATSSSDAVCDGCRTGETYQPAAGQPSCLPVDVKVCKPGTYVAQEPSPVSNRACGRCSLGSNFTDMANMPTCQAVQTCASHVEEKAAPTTSTDRNCCPQFQAQGICVKLCPVGTVPHSTTFVCVGCDGETGFNPVPGATECKPVSWCGAGEAVSSVATPSTDLVCSSCPSGQYRSRTQHRSWSCEPASVCDAGFAQSLPNVTQDVSCDACQPNSTWQNATGKNSCNMATNCSAGTFVAQAATATSDRKCRGCRVGETFQSEANAESCQVVANVTCLGRTGVFLAQPTLTSDRECRPHTSCASGEMESAQPTLSSDRVCVVASKGDDDSGSSAAVVVVVLILLALAAAGAAFLWRRRKEKETKVSATFCQLCVGAF